MNTEVTITLPEEFVHMCEFMDVSPKAFLNEFVRNILSYEDVNDPDGAEMALAIRYYLIYSANRNRLYERHVQIREAFVDKTILKVNPFLFELIDNGSVALESELQQFILDWKDKWKKANAVWQRAESPSGFQGDKQPPFILNRSINPFESIGIDIISDIVLQKGSNEHVRIESNTEIEHIIQTAVEDGRLWISVNNKSRENIPYATIYITYCTLKGIVVNNSGSVACKEDIKSDLLDVVQNGKGSIELRAETSAFDARLTGSGSLKISGSADKVTILNTGSGSIEGIEMKVSEAKITIKGSGNVSIHVEGELTAFLEGEGKLLLKGQPRLRSFVMDRE